MLTLSRRRIAISGATAVAALSLAACGGAAKTTSSVSASSAPTTSSSAAAGTARTRGGFGGLSTAELAKVTSCLKAAGITVPTMGTRTGGTGGTPPSGAPAGGFGGGTGGTPPSGAPTGGFAGGTGTRGAGGGLFSSTADKAALSACGITLPTRTGGVPAATAST